MSAAEWSEQFALRQLHDSTARILDNVGFTSTSGESINILTDVMRQYMENICGMAKRAAEHGGRTTFDLEDMELAFRSVHISGVELHEYIQQVGNIQEIPAPSSSTSAAVSGIPPYTPKVPVLARFPARKPASRLLAMAPPSDREANERRQKDSVVPPCLPTLNPDWNGNEALLRDIHKPSTSAEAASNSPEKKSTRLTDDFPSFLNMDATSLGIVRRAAPTPVQASCRVDHISATGIKSSANAIAKKLKSSKGFINSQSSGVKSARASPVPSHTASSNLNRRIESTPNLEGLVPKLAISLLKKDNERRPISPLVRVPSRAADGRQTPVVNSHIYDDIPVLEEVKTEPEENSIPGINKANSATPEYRMQESSLKDEYSQPPILTVIKDKKRDKKHKERRKHKEKHRDKDRLSRPPSSIPPFLEPAVSISPARVETPPMRHGPESNNGFPTTSSPSPLSSPRIRITIRDPHSNSPTAAFTPIVSVRTPQTPVADTPCSPHPASQPSNSRVQPPELSKPAGDSDSNTIPLIDGAPLEDMGKLQTTFPLNMSMDNDGDRIKEHGEERKSKKAKKKEKDRLRDKEEDSGVAKKEKEHKKKKKKDREKDTERERKKDKDGKGSQKTTEPEPSETRLTPLKIRILSPPVSEPSTMPIPEAAPIEIERVEPVRIKLKPLPVMSSRPESPAVKMSIIVPPKTTTNASQSERPRVKTKAELKAPPVSFPPLFSVDTKVVRPSTPKDKQRRSNTSTPVPPLARESPVPPVVAEKTAKQKEKDRLREKEKQEREEREKKEREERERKEKEDRDRKEKEEKERREREEKELKRKEEEAKAKKQVKQKEKETKKKVETVKSKKSKKEFKSSEFVLSDGDKTFDDDTEAQTTEAAAAAEGGDQVWICPVCSVAYVDGATMIGCDKCDDWYHWSCVGLVVEPPSDVPWYCDRCTKKKSQTKADKRKSTAAGGTASKKKKH